MSRWALSVTVRLVNSCYRLLSATLGSKLVYLNVILVSVSSRSVTISSAMYTVVSCILHYGFTMWAGAAVWLRPNEYSSILQYGFIYNTLRSLVVDNHGEEKWLQIW